MYIDYNSMPDDEFDIALKDDGFDDYPNIPMPLNCCTEGCNDELMVYYENEQQYVCPNCGRIVKLYFRRQYAFDKAAGKIPDFHAYDWE